MLNAVLKADELGNHLLDMLVHDRKLTEMSFYGTLRDIEKLNDNYSSDYLKALANAIYGRKDEAIAHFEQAMRHGDEVFDLNYLVYLHDVGLIRKAVDVADRIGDKYVSLILCNHAFETNLFLGRIDSALKYSTRYIKMAENKDAQMMRDATANALSRIEYFKSLSGFTDSDYEQLSSLSVNILEEKGIKPSSMRFCVVSEEKVNALIVTLPTIDAELLAEMNFDMAMQMAHYDNFLDKQFSFWFEGEEQNMEDVVHAC